MSGIHSRTLPALDECLQLLDARGVPVSLFVAPRRKHGYRIEDDPATREWLSRRRSDGDAIVLHGFDTAATKRLRGEFATMPAHEASLRLTAADRILERVGLRTRMFAAPGWMASVGTTQALSRNGFRILIGMSGTSDLTRGTTQRSRLIGIGAGFMTEPWWCRSVILAVERTARRGGTVRLAVKARQLAKSAARQAVLDAVDLALMHGCTPSVYRCHPDPALSAAA